MQFMLQFCVTCTATSTNPEYVHGQVCADRMTLKLCTDQRFSDRPPDQVRQCNEHIHPPQRRFAIDMLGAGLQRAEHQREMFTICRYSLVTLRATGSGA